jgi:hypothetical protein
MSPRTPPVGNSPEELKTRLASVTIQGRKYYVAEGDLLLEEHELEQYASESGRGAPIGAETEQLVAISDNGKIVRWKSGLELTYCILKATFSDAEYATVLNSMRQATSDWEKTCGVKFRHDQASDSANTVPPHVLFPVFQVPPQGTVIAAAFFPNDPKHRRQVVIFPSFFTTPFSKAGVLRHELGHVLGFRHEHIRSGAPAVCPKEALNNTIDLSDYDPQSVMHYFCGGVGRLELEITDVDRVASQRLYGPPLHLISFCE